MRNRVSNETGFVGKYVNQGKDMEERTGGIEREGDKKKEKSTMKISKVGCLLVTEIITSVGSVSEIREKNSSSHSTLEFFYEAC